MTVNWSEVFQTIGILTVAWLVIRTTYRHCGTFRKFTHWWHHD